MPGTGRQGMSSVELIVAVGITAILAAITIPFYMTYVQQARVISLVLPPLHIIESNVAMYYTFNKKLPGEAEKFRILEDTNTAGLDIALQSGVITLTINTPDPDSKLFMLNGSLLIAAPVISQTGISTWHLSGALADRLNLNH